MALFRKKYWEKFSFDNFFEDLNHSTHVFLNNFGIKKLLQPLYSGPYEIIARDKSEKTFTSKITNESVKRTIDMIKPMPISWPSRSSGDVTRSLAYFTLVFRVVVREGGGVRVVT